jgi:hypothetical protein
MLLLSLDMPHTFKKRRYILLGSLVNSGSKNFSMAMKTESTMS